MAGAAWEHAGADDSLGRSSFISGLLPDTPARSMGDTMSPAMSATVAVLTYPHITRDPAIRGGQSCLDGSRIAVADIVVAQRDGHRPEEICTLFGASLSLAQVHAALAYYYDHPGEIEEEFRLQAECFDQGAAERDRFLKARG